MSSRDVDLRPGEVELLIDGRVDDVSFSWALIHLGIRANPPSDPGPPTAADIDSAFRSFDRLLSAGLMRLGRVQYIDGGPPGRVAPVEHISEPIGEVRQRVEDACRSDGEWEFACWLVNTPAGDEVAKQGLDGDRDAR